MKTESLNDIAGRIYNEAFQETQRQLEDSKTLVSNPCGWNLENFKPITGDARKELLNIKATKIICKPKDEALVRRILSDND
jgi:hypothetical protein